MLLPLCYTNNVVNDTTEYLRCRWSKWGATWLLCSFDTIGTTISITPLHSLYTDKWNDVHHDFLWSCNLITLYTCWPHITEHTRQKKNLTKLQLLFPCYNHICANNKYVPQMPQICHMCTWDNCQYIYPIWTQCNQQCHNKHWYTYISHYWHIPLSLYAYHITYISTTALLQSTYTLHTTAYVTTTNNQVDFEFTKYNICTMHLATTFILYHQ